jgi:hypothetical protein
MPRVSVLYFRWLLVILSLIQRLNKTTGISRFNK